MLKEDIYLEEKVLFQRSIGQQHVLCLAPEFCVLTQGPRTKKAKDDKDHV